MVPYLFTIRRKVKLAWMGRKIDEVRPKQIILKIVAAEADSTCTALGPF